MTSYGCLSGLKQADCELLKKNRSINSALFSWHFLQATQEYSETAGQMCSVVNAVHFLSIYFFILDYLIFAENPKTSINWELLFGEMPVRVHVKIVIMTFRSLLGQTPAYIREHLHPEVPRGLWDHVIRALCIIPGCKLKQTTLLQQLLQDSEALSELGFFGFGERFQKQIKTHFLDFLFFSFSAFCCEALYDVFLEMCYTNKIFLLTLY